VSSPINKLLRQLGDAQSRTAADIEDFTCVCVFG